MIAFTQLQKWNVKMGFSAARLPFVKNAWYVGAWADELDDGLVGRTIMNQPLVFFRDAEGRIGALEDRCCHRGAPLTKGHVVEAGLQCGYHGLTYDRTGKCVVIPGQDRIAEGARVRSFPVVEKDQIAWIWMGDADRADETLIIDYPYHDLPEKWPHKKEMFGIDANYMLMIDNLMDLTHLGFLHNRTIGGNPNAHVGAGMESRKTERGAILSRWMLDSKPPPTFVKAGGFRGNIDRWQEFEYVGASIVLQWSGALDSGKGAVENRDQDGYHARLLHCATPETENSFHYFWSIANGYLQDDPSATQLLYDESYPTFIEDKEMLEAQQKRLELEPLRDLFAINADGAVALARAHVEQMVIDELQPVETIAAE